MDYLVANSFDDGDYFIVDPSHPFLSTILEYIAPLEEIGVKLVTLPKYSQVFSNKKIIKNKNNRKNRN